MLWLYICVCLFFIIHYCNVIMGAIASLITSITSVYSTIHSGADQRKHQSSASLAFVREIHRRPMNSLHKWPVTRKMFLLDDAIMSCCIMAVYSLVMDTRNTTSVCKTCVATHTWYYIILVRSGHSKSFVDPVPVNKIYGYPISKWFITRLINRVHV